MIRKMNLRASAAVARLMATAADDADPEDPDNKLTDDDQILALKEGVATALSQNQQFSEALHNALDEFDAHWIKKEDLNTEGVLAIKKTPELTAEELATQLTATVACFFKYLTVPKGTEENVTLPAEEGEDGEAEGEEGDGTDDKEGDGGNGDDTDTEDTSEEEK